MCAPKGGTATEFNRLTGGFHEDRSHRSLSGALPEEGPCSGHKTRRAIPTRQSVPRYVKVGVRLWNATVPLNLSLKTINEFMCVRDQRSKMTHCRMLHGCGAVNGAAANFHSANGIALTRVDLSIKDRVGNVA